MRTVLGIDLGTQSLKVVLYDYEARSIVAVASAPLQLSQDASGRAEQDPAWWLDALALALGEIGSDLLASIVAIGVSGQQHGLVALDTDGAVLHPAKLWCDTSTQPEVDEITAACGGRDRMIELAGNALVTGFTAPKIRWLRNHEPERYARMAHILLPHDYLNFALTGTMAMEFGDASGTGLLDVRRRDWCPELFEALDSERDLGPCLPPFVDAGQFMGQVSANAANRFGLAAGTPVAVGGGDNMMGAIGTGNVRAGVLTMSLGTSGTLYAYADRPVIDPKGEIAAFCSSTGGWLPLLCTMNCTFATELMRGPLDIAVTDFDSSIAAVPAGAEGLIALPFFNGERTPNLPNAKGCLLGLDAANCSKGHLLRATVEGVTFALRYGIDELAGLGLRGEEIILTGGGANSRVWRQIVADVSGLPVALLRHSEGASFGAALQALWTLERERDAGVTIGDIIDAHIELDASSAIEPDAARAAQYRDAYGRYQAALAQLAPLYAT